MGYVCLAAERPSGWDPCPWDPCRAEGRCLGEASFGLVASEHWLGGTCPVGVPRKACPWRRGYVP